jgi:hypothetical protein
MGTNGMGATSSDEEEVLLRARNPCTGKSCTWLRDETGLQSTEAEQIVERLRKPEDGT